MGGCADTRHRVVRAAAGSPRARPRERPDAVLSSAFALLPDGGSARSRRGPGPRARVPRHERGAVRASRGARPARRGSARSFTRGRPGASLRGRARELPVRRGPRRPGRPVLVRDPRRRRGVRPQRNHRGDVRVARVRGALRAAPRARVEPSRPPAGGAEERERANRRETSSALLRAQTPLRLRSVRARVRGVSAETRHARGAILRRARRAANDPSGTRRERAVRKRLGMSRLRRRNFFPVPRGGDDAARVARADFRRRRRAGFETGDRCDRVECGRVGGDRVECLGVFGGKLSFRVSARRVAQRAVLGRGRQALRGGAARRAVAGVRVRAGLRRRRRRRFRRRENAGRLAAAAAAGL